MAEYKDDNFLFESNNEIQNEELAFLNNESKNQDGIYRPRLEDAAEPKGAGYKATIRFLRNLKRDGSGTGPAAIKKHVHYADFKDYPELAGYYDCEKNITDKTPCPLCLTHWKLFNSNNQNDRLVKPEVQKCVACTPHGTFQQLSTRNVTRSLYLPALMFTSDRFRSARSSADSVFPRLPPTRLIFPLSAAISSTNSRSLCPAGRSKP